MEVQAAKATAYAPATVKNLKSQWKGYLLLCACRGVTSPNLTTQPVLLSSFLSKIDHGVPNREKLFELCQTVSFMQGHSI
jgi:hypothetical protein